jgi:aminoglycoside phosphotransferase (APT) family kinase protein
MGEHRDLVGRLFPQLGAIHAFQRIDGGWTYDTYLVNGEWIVQLPRDEHGADALVRQMSILPELAREVSAPVPYPELVSNEPPAMGYRRIDGQPAAGDAGIWPERLGRFLYDLHAVPPEFVGLRARSPDAVREDTRQEWARLRAAGASLLTPSERGLADDLFGRYLDDDRNWRFSPCLAHNDLGPEHVLVSPTGDLVGVIDWEEVSVADPVGDFAWWLHARPEVGERALAAYGGAPDDRFRDRSRISFARMPWHEVACGLSGGGESFVASGIAGVRERLALIGS